MGVGDGEVLYVGTGVEAGFGVGVMVVAELGVGVPAAVGVCVMAATAELLLRLPYPEPAQEKCEKWSGKIENS